MLTPDMHTCFGYLVPNTADVLFKGFRLHPYELRHYYYIAK